MKKYKITFNSIWTTFVALSRVYVLIDTVKIKLVLAMFVIMVMFSVICKVMQYMFNALCSIMTSHLVNSISVIFIYFDIENINAFCVVRFNFCDVIFIHGCSVFILINLYNNSAA